MSISWDLDAAKAHIQRLFGRQRMEFARPSLISVAERINYAEFHYHEANKLFLEFSQKHLENSSIYEFMAVSDDDNVNSEFQLLIIKTGAHLIACFQSIHALADIFAHAAYYSAGIDLVDLGLKPLEKRKINTTSVLDRLARVPDLSRTHDLLHEFFHNDDFKHVAALVNRSKHSNVIRPFLSENQTAGAPDRHTLMLAGFEDDTNPDDIKRYPEIDARQFIRKEYRRGIPLIVRAGIALNEALEKRMP